MDYLKDILDDDEKVKDIVSEVSSYFESKMHDDAWLALYRLGELIEEGRTDLIGSNALRETLRIAEIIRSLTVKQAEADAKAAEEAAIEAANEDRSELAFALHQTRNCA